MGEVIVPIVALLAFVVVAFVVASYAIPGRLLELGKELSRRAAGMARKRVEAAGHRIAYFERGQGEPVLLLHGFSSNKDGWLSYARALQGFRVIIPDLPGWGDSSYDASARYGFAEQADRVRAFIDALGVGPVHVAGNSMGGGIAGLLAARHPELVKSLLLMDSGAVEMPRASEFQRMVEEGENALIVRSVRDVPVLLDYVFHRKLPLPPIARRIYASEGMARIAENERIFEQLWDDWSLLEPELDAIRAPTLIMWGRHDRVIDVSVAEVLQRRIEGARSVIYDDAGHLPYMEVTGKAARDHRALIEAAAQPEHAARTAPAGATQGV